MARLARYNSVMTNMAMTVAVTTFNRRDLLSRCLDALLHQTLSPDHHELLVVDDGSTDGTDAMVAELAREHPHLRYHRHENAGRAVTRNRALALASGEILLYVDSDVIVAPGFLEAHLESHRRFQGRRGHDRVFCQGLSWNVSSLEAVGGPLPPFDPSRAFFDTKNVSIPRRLLEEVGGFHTGFTEYGWEDLELGVRLKRAGVRMQRSPRAVGYHVHPPFSLDRWEALRRVEEQRGRMAAEFFRLHPTWEVRLMIQLTPLHRLLELLTTLGGCLDERRIRPLLAWLERQGHAATAGTLARLVLNAYNLQELRRSL